MRGALWCLLLLLAEAACRGPVPEPPKTPLDPRDGEPVLLGVVGREAILQHRRAFRDRTESAGLDPGLRARWEGIRTPCILVAAFGSWCEDSRRGLPDLLALQASPNPFIEIRYIGVGRDKQAPPGSWPPGVHGPAVDRVPTFWLWAPQPAGGWRLVGKIVETPPIPGQRMAEAILALLEEAD
ncbi:MAG: hypothetical protein HY823_09390 [Acidobacteria bacterium]|nr:hypothetical protein [Acidobacteriota bacterium]